MHPTLNPGSRSLPPLGLASCARYLLSAALVAGSGTALMGADASYATPLLFTPTLLLDAEGGTLGQTYQGSGADQWSDAAGATTISNTQIFAGTKSFKCHAYQGNAANDGLFGTWGGRKGLPTPIHKGGTLHVQYATYIPSSFDWAANPWLKFVRFHVATSTGSNIGYEDIYIHNDGTLSHHSEVYGSVHDATGEIMQKNIWETIEFEVTFDPIPVDAGGQGRVRMWRYKSGSGMTLIYENTAEKTMWSDTDQCDAFLLFTYWNNRADKTGIYYPLQDQDCWVDRIVIETDMSKLVETDAQGRKIVGGVPTGPVTNHAPVASGQSVTTAEDTIAHITLTATDADSNPLSYAATNPSHGSITISGANVTYTPAANYAGSDSFTFTANDGTVNSNTATVSITVTAVNDAPTATAQSISTAKDTAVAITLVGSDIEGSTLTYAIGLNPTHGTLSGTGASQTYTPAAGYTGSDSFTFTVNDGALTSTAATVSITVTAGSGSQSGATGGNGSSGCGAGGLAGLIVGLGMILRLRSRRH